MESWVQNQPYPCPLFPPKLDTDPQESNTISYPYITPPKYPPRNPTPSQKIYSRRFTIWEKKRKERETPSAETYNSRITQNLRKNTRKIKSNQIQSKRKSPNLIALQHRRYIETYLKKAKNPRWRSRRSPISHPIIYKFMTYHKLLRLNKWRWLFYVYRATTKG